MCSGGQHRPGEDRGGGLRQLELPELVVDGHRHRGAGGKVTGELEVVLPRRRDQQRLAVLRTRADDVFGTGVSVAAPAGGGRKESSGHRTGGRPGRVLFNVPGQSGVAEGQPAVAAVVAEPEAGDPFGPELEHSAVVEEDLDPPVVGDQAVAVEDVVAVAGG